MLADIRQEVLLNLGEVNAMKVVYQQATAEHEEIPPARLQAISRVFAPPAHFQELRDKLQPPGAVLVLACGLDKGRTMLAHALLADLLHQRTISGARTLFFGGGSQFPASRIPDANRQGFVLELPDDEDEGDSQVSSLFGSQLAGIGRALSEHGNRMIVLTRPAQWRRIGHGAPEDVTSTIQAASALAIAEQWLSGEDSVPVRRWLGDSEITALLDRATPTDALEVVDLIVRAHRARPDELPALESLLPATANPSAARAHQQPPDRYPVGSEDHELFQRRVLSVIFARRDWRPQLLNWHTQPGRTGFQRNFLLAASVLRGAPSGQVYAKAAALCQALGEEGFSVQGQSAPGVLELVDSVEGRLQEGETIAFTRPGFDDAVMEYFWIDRPLARPPFLNWLGSAPIDDAADTLEQMSGAERQEIAERIATFALRWSVRHDKHDPLRALAEAWGKQVRHGRTAPLWPVLVETLSAAAVHRTTAPFVHRMLLRWAKSASTPQRKAVAAVCAGPFGRRHTGKALLRLRHLGASADAEVVDALHQAVRTLWTEESVRLVLLDDVLAWCEAPGAEAQAGRRAFQALAAACSVNDPMLPALLNPQEHPSFPPDTERLATGWQTLLDGSALEGSVPDASSLGGATSDEGAPQEAGPKTKGRRPTGSNTTRTGQHDPTQGVFDTWMSAALRGPALAATVLDALCTATRSTGPPGSQQRRNLLRAWTVRWCDQGPATEQHARRDLYIRMAQALDRDLASAVETAARSARGLVQPPGSAHVPRVAPPAATEPAAGPWDGSADARPLRLSAQYPTAPDRP